LLDGVRVIALDLRGHGLSEHADSYGYLDYVSDLTWLLDGLDNPLVGRIAKSVLPSDLDAKELELIAERVIETVEGGWRFRWDRRVLAPEPVDPFAFLGRVRCPVHVIAGSESEVMPPDKAHRFADAIPGGTVEIVDGAGHHVELDAPELLAERIVG